MSDHRGFLNERVPETRQASPERHLERGWIIDPDGNVGPIRHASAAVLPDTNTDPTLTPLAIAVIGLLSLVVGLAVLELGNFVAAQFEKARWLGWLTVAMLAPASAAILWAAICEWRGLAALEAVNKIRTGLLSENLTVACSQAHNWLKAIGAPADVFNVAQSAKDAETLRSLLRSGTLAKIDQEVSVVGKAAALRVTAATAVSPWSGLDGIIIIWQSLRMTQQIARLYGLRPGAFGTLRLLRRAATDAGIVAAADIAATTLTDAVFESHLGKLVGTAVGSTIAARRMLKLASAIAQSCRPLP